MNNDNSLKNSRNVEIEVTPHSAVSQYPGFHSQLTGKTCKMARHIKIGQITDLSGYLMSLQADIVPASFQ